MFFLRHELRVCYFPILGLCKFPVASMLRTDCCFPHVLLVVFAVMFWDAIGCYGVVLAMIGPRMTQELLSLVQAVNGLFGCMYAVVGLLTLLEWG